ncbi:MAG: hypothetical protein ACXQTR_05690 [Candidatus Methanospirareceae archaeon]
MLSRLHVLMIVKGLIVGAVAGAAYALAGYFKANYRNGEEFDVNKFLKTIVLGACLGAANYYFGIGLSGDEVAAMALAGEVAVIEQVLKAIFEKVRVE